VTLRLELSDAALDELVDRVAQRVAAIVFEQLGATQAESEFLTVDEAAAILRSSRQRVYDLLSDGRLERFKDGSRVLVRRADVVAHLRPTAPRGRTARRVAR
jgi:excisionase family DNA binding protein